jgi:hypothetical protein
MENLNPQSFADVYISAALEAVSVKDSLTLDDFYKYIYGKVSERTGLPEKDIIYVHHAFHWVLFLRDYSPLKIIDSKEKNGLTRVGLKSDPLEKSELVEMLLYEQGKWLEERMKKILSKSG